MSRPKEIRGLIEKITAEMVGVSLCNRQNFPAMRDLGEGITEIGIGLPVDVSVALKNETYPVIYRALDEAQAYNFQMLDGGLVQMMYRFKKKEIVAHRLAFFPSPFLEEFQNNPDIYIEDEVFAEVIMKNIVPLPIRFDFDCRKDVVVDIDHPQSHLTLGQYQNCRIPVCSPLMPNQFVEFILRNFYNTAFVKYSECVPSCSWSFGKTITQKEQRIPHLVCNS